jgi:hypothetical protein
MPHQRMLDDGGARGAERAPLGVMAKLLREAVNVREQPRHSLRERVDLREAAVAVAKDGSQPFFGAGAE